MRKPPQADELPRTEAGYDAARVEEAFAAFDDRVRELESLASELHAELKAVRAERTAPERFDDEDWPAEARLANGLGPARDWVTAVPPPFARGTAVPRLLAEGAFLLVVALLAGLADLAAPWIVLVMAVAWALVALTEWVAAAKRAAWRLGEIPPPADTETAADTGPWDVPVVEATVVESGPDPESQTIVARLPVQAEEAVPAAEPTPKRRRFRRRKRSAEASADDSAGDPWET